MGGLLAGSLVGLCHTFSARCVEIMCGFCVDGLMHPCSSLRAECLGWKPFRMDLIVFHFSIGSPPASSSSLSMRYWPLSFAAILLISRCFAFLRGPCDAIDSLVWRYSIFPRWEGESRVFFVAGVGF
jgi:hypothetical protein